MMQCKDQLTKIVLAIPYRESKELNSAKCIGIDMLIYHIKKTVLFMGIFDFNIDWNRI